MVKIQPISCEPDLAVNMFDEEDIVYGNPLPPLDDNESVNKKPELDLTVRDEKGRRRFHGAFTGGFSAGYFNTVGTEKGWIPSQYVSKKGQRWNKDLVSRKPEDFMDEEDFSLFGIAPKKVHTRDNFKGPEPEAFAGLRDPNASLVEVLRDIIKPSTQSIGVKLFMVMKKGRRYKGAFVKSQTNTKIYSCSMPAELIMSKDCDGNDYLNDDSIIKPELFSLPYKPKNNLHGIGYQPLKSTLLEDEERATPLTAILSGNKRLKITGEAFGYGTLEDDDDNADDALIYSKVDLSKYDFEIGSVKKQEPRPSTSALPSTCKGTLEGFVKGKAIEPVRSSKLIEIPKNWKPNPPFLQSKRPSRWNQPPLEISGKFSSPSVVNDSSRVEPSKSPVHSTKNQKKSKPLNANARAIILGEEVDTVVGIKKKMEVTPTKESTESKSSQPQSAYFSSKFVRSSEPLEEKLEPGLTESRSIVSSKLEDLHEPENVESKVGLIKRETFQWHPHTLLCKRFNVPHPYPQFPDVVGVINIKSGDYKSEIKKPNLASSKPNIFGSLSEISIISPTASVSSDRIPSFQSSQPSIDVTSSSPGEVVKHERPPLDLFKAIFASDESESEDDDNKKKEKEKDENLIEPDKVPTSSTKEAFENNDSSKAVNKESDNLISRDQAIQRKPSTFKSGIFSGINLDLLAKKISYKLDSTDITTDAKEVEVINSQVTPKDKEEIVADWYGPALPPVDVSTSSTSRDTSRKRKEREKEKKHKKSKHRSKHKTKKTKKKHKRRSSDSESSESESSNSNDSEIDAKLIKLIRSAR